MQTIPQTSKRHKINLGELHEEHDTAVSLCLQIARERGPQADLWLSYLDTLIDALEEQIAEARWEIARRHAERMERNLAGVRE